MPRNKDGFGNFALAEAVCPACEAQGLRVFHDVRGVPVHGTAIMPSKEEAVESPRGDILLGLCKQCGFISNIAFKEEFFSEKPMYEDQQGFSPTFKAYTDKLARHLLDKYHLHNKTIVEIGCGKGDFLHLLCDLGNNKGVGIDPLSENRRGKIGKGAGPIFIQEKYSEALGRRHQGDLVCCRHTLEHIGRPLEFLRIVRRSLEDSPGTVVFFEVPDVSRILNTLSFWDIYYEHCSYFCSGSLARLFRRCGFELIDLARVYDEQYILIEAIPAEVPPVKKNHLEESPGETAESVGFFHEAYHRLISEAAQRFRNLLSGGRRTVIWGSGSKCVAFVTTLGIQDEIEYVIDINPHRHGKFIPGAGKKIMPPEFLKEYAPDTVIVMNPVYMDEIQTMLDDMEVKTEVISF